MLTIKQITEDTEKVIKGLQKKEEAFRQCKGNH